MQAFGLQQADFLAVIDGMDMDVEADIRAPDLATLDLYCDRVAGAVGRLSIRVFGMEEAPGAELAHQLGRALQLTNILRDLDEDAAIGRLYLPRELLAQAGIEHHRSERRHRRSARRSAPAGRSPRRRSIISRRPTGCCDRGRAAACWRRG